MLRIVSAVTGPAALARNTVCRCGIANRDCYDSRRDPLQQINHAAPRDLRTVFLDRDGILNEKMPEGQYVTRWEEFRVLPGVPEALRRLNDAGLRVIVVTNQRGIARGLYTLPMSRRSTRRFSRLLNGAGARIDAFFICPHDDGQCNCRKPLPGLFEQAVARFPDITAATSVMIGDSLSDIEFGRRLGMKTIFIEGDENQRSPAPKKPRSWQTCASLPCSRPSKRCWHERLTTPADP